MTLYQSNRFIFHSILPEEIESELPDTLQIGRSPSDESIFFRLILGTLELKKVNESTFIKQNISFTKVRDSFLPNLAPNPIMDWIGGEFGPSDLDFYFKRNRKNISIFNELLSEFSLYFHNKSNRNFVSAFLNLYRSLEHISISFPSTFLAKTTNYNRSYSTIKSYFSDRESGQLKFFKNFTNTIFEKQILKCKTSIDTYYDNQSSNDTTTRIIKSLCNDFEYFQNGNVIEVRQENLIELFINIRNRYFHFQSDNPQNISNQDFDAEGFFEVVNDIFANWISMIYLEILVLGVYKIVLTPSI